MAMENICSVSAKIPQELYEQVLTYTKEKNISIASLIKTLLINEVNTSQQNQEQSGKSNQVIPSGNIYQNTPIILPDSLELILNQLLENSRQTTSLLNSYLSGTIQEKNQEQSGTYDILSKINNNLERLSSSIVDDKSSKIPETKQSTDLLTTIPIDDTWEEENSQEDCAQYVDKDGNLLTPEEYQKAKEEHDKYMEEFELQRKLEKQAHEVELRNQIKPMPHYTHLETYKDENSVIYQETYKQYQLRYNTIRTKNLQNTFELLNYMAPVLKTEKIYREFLEKIDAAESSNNKHLWQRAGGYNNYNLQKHLESLAAAQAQYPTYQKLNLPNFIPYTIQEEKTPKKAIVWDV